MAKKNKKEPMKPSLSKEEVKAAIKEIKDMSVYCALRGAYHKMSESLDKTVKFLEHSFNVEEE